MLGCFGGIVFLSLSKSGLLVEADAAGQADFYIGLVAIMITSIGYSVCAVLTRTMKKVHFSIMQFLYGGISTMLIITYLLIEFAAIN